ncbi:MAG: conserved rane protein of unknown function [Clostridia bacterium]|jgi:uncharacterized protein YybS (DUF2232 family)|nr:conserved rane protein of unknown function [Clostridia bacterium]
MKTINTRAMMEGAILAALTAIMGIFYNVPIVGVITMFWAVPIIIVGYRNGFRVSLIAAFIAALLVSLIATPIVGIILFATYAIPGAVMGYMLRKRFSPYMTLTVCSLLLAITAVLQFVLSLELILGIDIIDIIWNLNAVVNNYYNQIYHQASQIAEMYKTLGLGEAEIKQALEQVAAAMKEVKRLMPAGFLFAGVMGSFINFKTVKMILNRMGYKIEDINKFSQWSLNKTGRNILLGITFIVLFFMYTKLQVFGSLLTNIWAALLLVYVILGLSVLVYFKEELGEKYEIPKPVQNLVFVFLVLLMVGILPYIGMFDIASNIRRKDRNIPGGAR